MAEGRGDALADGDALVTLAVGIVVGAGSTAGGGGGSVVVAEGFASVVVAGGGGFSGAAYERDRRSNVVPRAAMAIPSASTA